MATATRQFSLFDVMVLVAATAIGLGIARSLADTSDIIKGFGVTTRLSDGSTNSNEVRVSSWIDASTARRFQPSWKGPLILWSRRIAFWPGPFLAAWTLATLGLSLRESSRGARRIARRPGSAACLAVLLALAATAILWPQLLLMRMGTPPSIHWLWQTWWTALWSLLPSTAGFGVVVAWSLLALGGRWAPSPGWYDRLGRILGVGWIAMATSGLAADWLTIPMF